MLPVALSPSVYHHGVLEKAKEQACPGHPLKQAKFPLRCVYTYIEVYIGKGEGECRWGGGGSALHLFFFEF